jgi:hypothetical protein
VPPRASGSAYACSATKALAGMDVSGESVPYVAGWGETGELDAIRAYAQTIDEAERVRPQACRRPPSIQRTELASGATALGDAKRPAHA